jgi:hypothetical protein
MRYHLELAPTYRLAPLSTGYPAFAGYDGSNLIQPYS